ncbi:MAG: DNA replication/repair protein RecF, partial [Bacilli bacterium]
MIIEKLKVRNYRNYQEYCLEFNHNTTVIIGDNGIGKTNLLESIALLSSTKSFRTNSNNDLIKQGSEYAIIDGKFIDFNLRITISNLGRNYFKNQSLIKSSSEFIGLFQSIVFHPGDLNFLINSPKDRRKFIDSELSKINKGYLINLNNYNKLIKDRNALFKAKELNLELLAVINDKLSELMLLIAKQREIFITHINKYLNKIFINITKENDQIELIYKSNVKNLTIEEIIDLREENKERDIITKQTKFRTHRDDLNITFNQVDA